MVISQLVSNKLLSIIHEFFKEITFINRFYPFFAGLGSLAQNVIV